MLKSVMADAKKGDSFMRQNRMKKCLTTVLSGILVLSLSGCGQTAKLPEEVVNTSSGGEGREGDLLPGQYF